MCITLQPATLSGTILYAAESKREGKYIHVLGYQNTAASVGPNAMVLPFPTDVPMGPENIVDTRNLPRFLKEYRAVIRPPVSRGGLFAAPLSSLRALVFDSGSYTVVLTNSTDPLVIRESLQQVPVDKRPPENPSFYEALGRLYPGEPIAICCWAGEISPEPLLWWYEPKDKENFRLPGLDAHDGGVPRRGQTRVDHTLIFASLIDPIGHRAYVEHGIPEPLRPYVAGHVNGVPDIQGFYPNGDFVLPVRKVEQQRLGDFQRVAPPGL